MQLDCFDTPHSMQQNYDNMKPASNNIVILLTIKCQINLHLPISYKDICIDA